MRNSRASTPSSAPRRCTAPIPNLTQDEMAERIEQTVTHARNLCDNVQWSPMDATRTEWDYLCRVVEIAIKAGATTINIPDTVGYTAPVESADLIRRLIETVPGGDEVIFATHCHNDLGMATANALAAVQGGARQIECTINGLGERAGNTALEEVVMALRVRNDIMPYHTGVDTKKIMHISRRVATVSGFAVQFNKAIVGKNAFAHESGIHQDGMLKNAETFEIMRPEDVGLAGTSLPLGKHSGRAALRAKLRELGTEVGDNQLKDIFVRFKDLADRKKEVFDDDILALVTATTEGDDALQLVNLSVVCGTGGPAQATLEMEINGEDMSAVSEGDGPVDASFKAIRMLHPNKARLQLYQVNAVTEGTDAQATVSVRLEEDGMIATGQSADTDTVVASAKAYIHALNRLIVRRGKTGKDVKEISYRDGPLLGRCVQAHTLRRVRCLRAPISIRHAPFRFARLGLDLRQTAGFHQARDLFLQKPFIRHAAYGHASGFKKQRCGKRRHTIKAQKVDPVAHPFGHLADTGKIDQTTHRLFAGDLHQQVVGIVFQQRVIKDVRRHGCLPPGLALTTQIAFDQTGDGGRRAEGAFHHRVASQPAFETRLQRCQIEQRCGVDHRVQPPDQHRVIGGDKAHGGQPFLLHPLGQQQPQRLHRVATGKAIGHELFAPVMREAFDQQAPRFRQPADPALHVQPVARVAWQVGPVVLLEHSDNAVGKLRGGGELGAHEGGDLGLSAGVTRDLDGQFAQPFIAHDLPADQEGVTLGQRCGKAFLDLAQRRAAPAPPFDLERVGVLDGADILADAQS